MIVAKAVEKMVSFYDGNHHDINHFMKVWAYARTIGEVENLEATVQETLELAAVVHDIACPLCRKKYGQAYGQRQEEEGPPLVREFYKDFGLPKDILERICYLVGHHHTTSNVDGLDYRILLEADFLVNSDEDNMSREQIISFRDKVFRTKTGTALLNDIYKL